MILIDNLARIWAIVFGTLTTVEFVMFNLPRALKKRLSATGYLIRGGTALVFASVVGAKLCVLLGWSTDWQHIPFALGFLMTTIGLTIVLVRFRKDKSGSIHHHVRQGNTDGDDDYQMRE